MPDTRRPPRSDLDAELRESLELMATLVASVSDRVEGQAGALDRMAKVLAETRTAAFSARKHADPAGHADRVAAQVEARLGRTLGDLQRHANALDQKTAEAGRVLGELRERAGAAKMVAWHEEQAARAWRDRRRRLLTWAGPALLALLLLTALLAPRLVALSDTLCSLAGATWFENVSGRTCAFRALW